MIFPTRAQFYSTVFKQFFVLPDSIVYYISKNPISPKCYKKIIQTCKYFFIQSSIIVLAACCCGNKLDTIVDGERKKFALKNNFKSKLWITDNVVLSSSRKRNRNLSLLLSKVYRFDGKQLYLSSVSLIYNELLLLSSKVVSLRFDFVTVKYDDGSIVPFEKIFAAFSKIGTIQYCANPHINISSQTVKELLKLPHFLTLYDCALLAIPEDFDIESFYSYMKKNKQTKFLLEFFDPLSEAYKNRLEEIVDEIIEDKHRDYKPPLILFPGLNEAKEKHLKKVIGECY